MYEILIALIAFAVSMIALVTPVIKLNNTITKLNTTVSLLNTAVASNETNNKAAHKEFYRRVETLEADTVELKTKMDIYHSNT